jgi:hypothetical protein
VNLDAPEKLDRNAAYLQAATSAAALLGDPAVAAAWAAPSALRHYRVAGLAGHLAGQIFSIPSALDMPAPDQKPIPILDYYAQVPWLTADHDDESHVRIRTGSENQAADGPVALAKRAADTVESLRDILPAVPPERTVRLPTWGPWSLRLDDFVLTRTMELVVHADDLAVSVGLPTPALPLAVTDSVIDLLARIASRRHGPTAMLRALSRAERAPATIAAF